MRLVKTISITCVVCATLLLGCAIMQPNVSATTLRPFYSSIDSVAQADASVKKRYVLLPGGKWIESSDLQFQEFAAYIDKVLTEKGFVKASVFQDADVAIFFTYAIGDPQTYQYSYSLPTWGQTGVSSANTDGTISTYGRTATYSSTTTYTPKYGVTGFTTHIASNTVYTRFLFFDAYDVAIYVKENKMNQVWKTSVVSTGSSNDLRIVVPYMVTAMKPYLGTNTGRKIEVKVLADDPAVQLLRSQTSAAPQDNATLKKSLSLDLTGISSGPYNSSRFGPQTMTINIQQNGTLIAGTFSSTTGGRGNISGTISGNTISFVINITTTGCSGKFIGIGIVNFPQGGNPTMSFNYDGNADCGGQESGTGVLTKQ